MTILPVTKANNKRTSCYHAPDGERAQVLLSFRAHSAEGNKGPMDSTHFWNQYAASEIEPFWAYYSAVDYDALNWLI